MEFKFGMGFKSKFAKFFQGYKVADVKSGIKKYIKLARDIQFFGAETYHGTYRVIDDKKKVKFIP
jgi:hypothetical protein